MNTTFWDKWKVFILGLAGAVAIALQELLANNPTPDYKVYAYAALMAALSFVATEWRGKNVSITGIIGTLAGVFVSLNTTGTFTWNQFILSGIAAVLATVAPPPKPSTYEHDANIVSAKEIPPDKPVEDNSKLPIGTTNP